MIMELKRTHCEKYWKNEDGEITSVVKKRKYKTMEKAQIAADEQNVMNSRSQLLNPYKCSVCSAFHVGRTGEKITDDDVDAIYERRIERKYKVPTFKIVGKIDLSKFEKTVKIKKSGKKKIKYK